MQIAQFIGLSQADRAALEGPSLPRGAIRLDTSIGSFDSDSLVQVESVIGKDEAHIVWMTPDKALRISSQWSCDSQTGVWSRRDRLQNAGKQEITIYRALGRFVLAPGQYETYTQNSQWCKENQGSWRPLDGGGLLIRCEGGQTCRGASPYLCIRDVQQHTGMAYHVLPAGNWTIRVTTHSPKQRGLPFAIVELGLDDDHLRLVLPAQRSLDLPEILFYPTADGDISLAAPPLHRYLLNKVLTEARHAPPVVYNTWFFQHEWFTLDGLRLQLAAAKQIGCEVFVVDAGWYGQGQGGWQEQVGDWREKLGGAFGGRMSEFAAEVRAAGLGFGLWMEPERLHASVPIIQQHPQWFCSTSGTYFHPNLDNVDAYNYILSEMSRLIQTYKLAWMKVDFNYERGVDASGAEYLTYYRNWYRLLDQLRAAFPACYLEGCASGGMRLDISTLAGFDGHFLTDTVTPFDVLRISQGALLRLPPGRITKWTVLSAPKDAVGTRRAAEVLAPLGAHNRQMAPTTVDFAARAALAGHFGLSGDLASLAKPNLERLAYHVAWYKKWRDFIANSVGHLLTPPRLLNDSSGWAAFQLQHQQDTTSLAFAYRLDDPNRSQRFRLRSLQPERSYTVSIDDKVTATLSGRQLMEDGITIDIPTRNGAQIAAVVPTP